MHVQVLNCTKDPLDTISLAAGTCYGKTDISVKRVRNCIVSGHMSVLEHASVTFKVEGISRACSHQLVRHRLASYSQESQRYCKYDIDSTNDDWYVTPPIVERCPRLKEWYDERMKVFAGAYMTMLLKDAEMKPEDARYLLPEAMKTTIVVTMNARELFHFFDLRQSKRSQWEIRELATEMEEKLSQIPGWKLLLEFRKEAIEERNKMQELSF